MDDVRNEALLVLHFHRVERAAVGIDADQVIVLFRDLEHALSASQAKEVINEGMYSTACRHALRRRGLLAVGLGHVRGQLLVERRLGSKRVMRNRPATSGMLSISSPTSGCA